MLAALGGKDLLDFHVTPAEQLQHRIDQNLLGLGFVRLVNGEQALNVLQQACLDCCNLTVRKRRPRLTAGDAFEQIVAREQVAGNHESGPLRLGVSMPSETSRRKLKYLSIQMFFLDCAMTV
ncbi:MAG: hypothetical protein ABL904_21500 [Hyphomicrobiaceae bacterium]